jgi:hypothetical protein
MVLLLDLKPAWCSVRRELVSRKDLSLLFIMCSAVLATMLVNAMGL